MSGCLNPARPFIPTAAQTVEVHPLRGLLRFRSLLKGLVPDPIRVATLAPSVRAISCTDL